MAIDPRIILQGAQPTQFDPMGAMQQGLTMRHLLDTRARQKQQWALEDQQRQQAAAQRVLELGQLHADRRRRDVQALGREPRTAGLDDFAKIAQLAQIHFS